MNVRAQRFALGVAAPLLALVLSFVIISVILVSAGDPVWDVWREMRTTPAERNWANILDKTTIYYLAGLAVAISFRMNLFNIGVEGQFLVAALVAALVAGEAWLPGYLNTGFAILVAMIAGALYAGIAGVLRAYRGVSEVISTIMLNAIAVGLTAYLLRELTTLAPGSNTVSTKPIPEGSRIPGISVGEGPAAEIYGFVVIAAVAGFVYWFLLNRTRFGFDLRTTGRSLTAAVASGVNVKRMIVIAMMLSGAFAALVGLPYIFGEYYSYGSTFPAGIGFTGIAVALIGRNNPIGIALGAILFAYLEERSNVLQIEAGVSPEIVKIMQGTILLMVVISYEVVRRYGLRLEQQQVARALARDGADDRAAEPALAGASTGSGDVAAKGSAPGRAPGAASGDLPDDPSTSGRTDR